MLLIRFQGQVFSGLHHKVLLLGNPVIWYLVLGLMLAFLGLYAVFAFQRQRGVKLSQTYIREFTMGLIVLHLTKHGDGLILKSHSQSLKLVTVSNTS